MFLCLYSVFLRFPPPHLSRPVSHVACHWSFSGPPYWICCPLPIFHSRGYTSNIALITVCFGMCHPICTLTTLVERDHVCFIPPLAHSRPLQCVQSNESVTFFIYSLWSLFYELSCSEWAFVFFLLSVPKEGPSLDWWCPNYRHER